jgi:transcriptional regulator with XRE-family HTH domain
MHNPIPIKVAMVRRNINGEKLAELAGVSRPTVSRIVNGKQVLPAKLEAVVTVLGLTMAEVYEPGPAEPVTVVT